MSEFVYIISSFAAAIVTRIIHTIVHTTIKSFNLRKKKWMHVEIGFLKE